jgi:type II secretory pathway component PulC
MLSGDRKSLEGGLIEALKAGKPPRRRWLRRLPRVLAVAVAAAFGIWAMTLLLPHWLEYRESQAAPASAATPASSTTVIARNAETSVLGTSASASAEAQALLLVSTSVGSTPSESTAMLGTDIRNPQTYAVGSVLANGAVISEIHADRVVLELEGRKATLAMRGGPAAPETKRDRSASSGHSNIAATIGGPRSMNRSLARTPSSRDDFSQIMRSQLVFEHDKVAGLLVLAGTRSDALDELGLRAGDIIRSIEGKPVEGAAALQLIDDAVTAGEPIVVGVEREGTLTSMMLDGARLSDS